MNKTKEYLNQKLRSDRALSLLKAGAVDEIKERLEELEESLDPMAERRAWNDLILTYKPSANRVKAAAVHLTQLTSLIEPYYLRSNATKPNFLVNRLFGINKDNGISNESKALFANAVMCAGLDKIDAGMYVFQLDELHKLNAYTGGFECFKVLMPTEFDELLTYYADRSAEQNELTRQLHLIEGV